MSADDRDRPHVWPAIPFEPWRETCAALHLWCQIVGQYRLAHAPWVNHSWHATLYVVPRGLTTGVVPDPNGAIMLDSIFSSIASLRTPKTAVPINQPVQ